MRGEEYRKKRNVRDEKGEEVKERRERKKKKKGKKGGFCCGVLFSFIQIPFEARYFFDQFFQMSIAPVHSFILSVSIRASTSTTSTAVFFTPFNGSLVGPNKRAKVTKEGGDERRTRRKEEEVPSAIRPFLIFPCSMFSSTRLFTLPMHSY